MMGGYGMRFYDSRMVFRITCDSDYTTADVKELPEMKETHSLHVMTRVGTSLYVLDLAACEEFSDGVWAKLPPPPKPETPEETTASFTGCAYSNALYMTYTSAGAKDVWKFCLNSREWETIATVNNPDERHCLLFGTGTHLLLIQSFEVLILAETKYRSTDKEPLPVKLGSAA
jgi:hypothetical protein